MVDLDNVSTASGEASISSSGNNNNNQTPKPTKKKRNLPGMPDPEAEVIALSPTTLLATNRFVCEICNKGFQRDQNLQLHRRGHNLPWKLRQRSSKEVRKRVYVCPESTCVHHDPSRALGDLTGIKKHFCRKHGEKKWKCDKCSKKYAVQSDWKAHSKVCGSREYKCDCGTVFSRRDSFITHRAFCDALAEENAKSQNQAVGKANSESDSKVLTGDSLPVAPTPAAITTPQSNSGVSSALENQKLDLPENPPQIVEEPEAIVTTTTAAAAAAVLNANCSSSSSTSSTSNGRWDVQIARQISQLLRRPRPYLFVSRPILDHQFSEQEGRSVVNMCLHISRQQCLPLHYCRKLLKWELPQLTHLCFVGLELCHLQLPLHQVSTIACTGVSDKWNRRVLV
ncbi:unnamed protein product [Trifolium pratense]|uniref:Uncharacterized protein n=1 Tax=Trifolium pratense TaxID=57577 RepID=A0ACB0ISK8_TRIPR|nr:unnamed protein product [Trifolium pratense]